MSALDNSHQLVKSEICSQPEEKDHGNETPGLIQPGFDEPALESNDEHESSSNWSPTKSPELIEERDYSSRIPDASDNDTESLVGESRYRLRPMERPNYQMPGLKFYKGQSSPKTPTTPKPSKHTKTTRPKRSKFNILGLGDSSPSFPATSPTPTKGTSISSFAAALAPGSATTSAYAPVPGPTNARFQFFIADQSLGAISKTVDQCSTSNAFFDEAFAAYTIVGEKASTSQMAGVKVVIESSASRPIFVPWRNKESYDEMMEVVMEMAAGRTGRMDVEVTCVKKGK